MDAENAFFLILKGLVSVLEHQSLNFYEAFWMKKQTSDRCFLSIVVEI
jgi:hypothetical protein